MTPRLPHMLLAVSATILAACSTPSGTSTEKAAMLEHEQLAGAAWQVQQLNGQPVTNATLTLNFHEPGWQGCLQQLHGKLRAAPFPVLDPDRRHDHESVSATADGPGKAIYESTEKYR